MRSVPARSAQLGLTLIELMVSITIGLVVVGAVSYLYIGSRGAYRGNEALARIQDAGRFALDAISRDVRRAGALGCGSGASVAGQGALKVNTAGATASTGIHPATLTVDGSGQPIPIEGFEPTAYTPPPITSAPSGWSPPTGAPAYWGGDILQLQIASGAPVRVTNMDTTNGNLTIVAPTASTGNFNSSNYALLANCSAAAVFQVQSASTASGFSTLGYAPASGTVPVLTSTGQFSLALDTYPTVQHYDQVTYYLGRSPSGLPALYRYSLSSNTTEELVENIEDMDVVYGVGTHGVNVPSAITGFMKANAMTATDFSNVISVRVSVIAVGDQRGAAPTAQTLMFHGTDTNATTPTAWTATDTRLRQVFTATVALRDRVN